MINHQYKCIFIHQRKCAGTSIINGFGMNPQMPEWHAFNDGVRSIEPENWHSVRAKYADYTVFSIVRNPWDRFVSGWKYCASTKHRDIVDVLRNLPREGHDYRHVTRPQSEILFDDDGQPACDFLLRFENLQADWDEMCARLGKPPSHLPHLNASNRQPYHACFNDTALALFEAHFGADIRIFGYRYDLP